MPTDTGPSKPERRIRAAPRHIGAVLPAVTRPAFRTAGPAVAQLMADWPEIVGPALAAVSTPLRFSAGTLTLNCMGPAAMELQHLSAQLTERVNGHLGRPLVQRLRLVQHAVRRQQRPALPQRARAVPPKPIADFPEGPLRDALQRLGGHIDGA